MIHSAAAGERGPHGTEPGGVRVEPQHRSGAAPGGEPAERAQRDRVVTAEQDRDPAVIQCRAHQLGDPFARRPNRRQEARPWVVFGGRFRHRGSDVASVDAIHAQRGETLLQPRLADRRRTHVDAPPPGSQIERCANDRGFHIGGLHHPNVGGAAEARGGGLRLALLGRPGGQTTETDSDPPSIRASRGGGHGRSRPCSPSRKRFTQPAFSHIAPRPRMPAATATRKHFGERDSPASQRIARATACRTRTSKLTTPALEDALLARAKGGRPAPRRGARGPSQVPRR